MADSGALSQLNRDIWLPFMRAYAERDAVAFEHLHAPELIRVESANRWAGDLTAYLDRTAAFFDDMTARGVVIGIGFRFVERVADGSIASERGVYRIDMAPPGVAERVFYGRFHTFARKSDERWRIVVDYDTTDAGTVDEAAFAAANELTDFAVTPSSLSPDSGVQSTVEDPASR